jgi:cyclophilin family peptidyl-prolyl cis-trans isomerase
MAKLGLDKWGFLFYNAAMSEVAKRVILVIAVLAGVLGVAFLISSFLRHEMQLVPEEKLSITTGTEISTSAGQLEVIDDEQMQSGATFSVRTDLQNNTEVLPPLKKSSEFVTKTANEVTLTTSKGKIVIKLYGASAPNTITNLLTLVDAGFYDKLKFHRVEPGFLVQIGDPASRDVETREALLKLGAGDPGYRIADEIDAKLSHNKPGIVAMANRNVDGSLPDSAGSQFYITTTPATYLDGRYSIFGEVVSGMEVVERLQVGDVIESVTYR